MAVVSRTLISGVTRPTTRLTRRAALWTVRATRVAAKRTAGAAQRASAASRIIARTLGEARSAALARLTRERPSRATMLPTAPGCAEVRAADATGQRHGLPVLLFAGGVVTGAVYGLSNSWAQALTTGACAATLALVASLREAQRRDTLAIQQSLSELRESLRVTQALLEVEELQDAEELRATSSIVPPAYDDDATRPLAVGRDSMSFDPRSKA